MYKQVLLVHQYTSTSGWWTDWEHPCREEFGGVGGWKAQHEPTIGSCQFGQKASYILGCIETHVTSMSRKDFPLLLCPGETPAQERDMDLLEQVQSGTTKIIRVVEHLFYEESLKELGLFSWDKRRLWEDLNASFQYIKEAYRKDGEKHSLAGSVVTVLNWKRIGSDLI